ncbi:MAG: ATP-grasp domain-containing protein [Fibrobacterota bacterium]
MIIPEYPYISDSFSAYIEETEHPVCDTAAARAWNISGSEILPQEEFFRHFQQPGHERLYTNSEDALDSICRALPHTDLVRLISVFKDKGRFRDALRDMTPNLNYAKIPAAEAAEFDADSFGYPFIIKPAVGFMSRGVEVISSRREWQNYAAKIMENTTDLARGYSRNVIRDDIFLAEEMIPGKEFALDVYYTPEGEPVILSILHHRFSGMDDVSDRVYSTSAAMIDKYHDLFHIFLQDMGAHLSIRNFSFHAEFRITPAGKVIPIEINPVRFTGWCAADLAWFAYGINPYAAFLNDERPNLREISARRKNKTYSIIVADVPADIPIHTIDHIDYDAFAQRFSSVLSLRKMDWQRYGLFAFAFVQTDSSTEHELEDVLHSDLRNVICLKNK